MLTLEREQDRQGSFVLAPFEHSAGLLGGLLRQPVDRRLARLGDPFLGLVLDLASGLVLRSLEQRLLGRGQRVFVLPLRQRSLRAGGRGADRFEALAFPFTLGTQTIEGVAQLDGGR